MTLQLTASSGRPRRPSGGWASNSNLAIVSAIALPAWKEQLSREQPKNFSFNLPDGVSLDAYVVRLPDGRLVVRGSDELEAVPPASSTPPAGVER